VHVVREAVLCLGDV